MKKESKMRRAVRGANSLDEMHDAIEAAKREMGEELMSFINSFHHEDWPTLAALMKITAENIAATLRPSGRAVYDMELRTTEVLSLVQRRSVNE